MEIIENMQRNIDDFKNDILKLDQFLTETRISYSFFQQKYPEVQKEFKKKSRNEAEIKGIDVFDNLNDLMTNHIHCYHNCEIYRSAMATNAKSHVAISSQL